MSADGKKKKKKLPLALESDNFDVKKQAFT